MQACEPKATVVHAYACDLQKHAFGSVRRKLQKFLWGLKQLLLKDINFLKQSRNHRLTVLTDLKSPERVGKVSGLFPEGEYYKVFYFLKRGRKGFSFIAIIENFIFLSGSCFPHFLLKLLCASMEENLTFLFFSVSSVDGLGRILTVLAAFSETTDRIWQSLAHQTTAGPSKSCRTRRPANSLSTQ